MTRNKEKMDPRLREDDSGHAAGASTIENGSPIGVGDDSRERIKKVGMTAMVIPT